MTSEKSYLLKKSAFCFILKVEKLTKKINYER
ncbi:hypothetical protein DSH66_04665 [Enterococcus faecalis]|nr:hypothetical protein [Enterococcus faecalis]QCX15296.1 hypothetical protein DOU31_11360 [Enterococcus faecalis]